MTVAVVARMSATVLLLLVIAISTSSAQDPRQTIPEAVAEGAVSSVSTVPSGQPPTLASLLAQTDLIVTGTVGEPHAYLSEDQRDIFTDYLIANPVFRYLSKLPAMPIPGLAPAVVVTQFGGTAMVNGIRFTQKETALPPLQAGTTALFLLHRVDNKNLIVGRYFGAFAIAGGRVKALVAREDFAPEYRDSTLAAAIDGLTATLRSLGR